MFASDLFWVKTSTGTFTIASSIASSRAKSLKWVKLELEKYYKDSEMTAFISERSMNSK